eukprot:1296235-Rhodomonas_salina.3
MLLRAAALPQVRHLLCAGGGDADAQRRVRDPRLGQVADDGDGVPVPPALAAAPDGALLRARRRGRLAPCRPAAPVCGFCDGAEGWGGVLSGNGGAGQRAAGLEGVPAGQLAAAVRHDGHVRGGCAEAVRRGGAPGERGGRGGAVLHVAAGGG